MSDETQSDKAAQAPAESEAPPKAPDTVTLTIDGQNVTVPKGTNVLEAARSVGIEISAFCYHPGLSIAACCRQCLVTVEKAPKLQPSCQQIAGDGMVVHTKDADSTLARKQMLEFTLVNHPIDCPICDKAGECTLQKLYFDADNEASRVDVPKVRKPKVVDLGPHIVLDAERCILCTRCIRVCDEVARSHQLEMSWRGDREQLGTAPGEKLDNPYSLNTVDVCPVGALTSKDYRFTMRAWELQVTPTICTGCATGCASELHHKDGRAWRTVPRHNDKVNKYWMCDEGRFQYHSLRNDRLAGPTMGGLPSSWNAAISAAASRLGAVIANQRDRVGVVFSPCHSNEANFVLAKLARDIWQLERLYIGGRAPDPGFGDDILRSSDRNPNLAGVQAILGDASVARASVLEQDLLAGDLQALIVMGHELALSEEASRQLGQLDVVVAIADRELGPVRHADIALASAAWAECHGTMVNRFGHVQRLRAAFPPAGQALPAWEVVTRLAKASDAAINYAHPKKVFQDMIATIEAFKGADWGKEARPMQLRWADSRG